MVRTKMMMTPDGQSGGGEILLRLENLVKYFPVGSGKLLRGTREFVHAVDGVRPGGPQG